MIKIEMKKEFAQDRITREAGERLRHIILDAEKQGQTLEIDFSGLIIASTSFFDESIAKLSFEGWNLQKFKKTVVLNGINLRDQKLLEDLCRYRGLV